jgi:hypothetical protein
MERRGQHIQVAASVELYRLNKRLAKGKQRDCQIGVQHDAGCGYDSTSAELMSPNASRVV